MDIDPINQSLTNEEPQLTKPEHDDSISELPRSTPPDIYSQRDNHQRLDTSSNSASIIPGYVVASDGLQSNAVAQNSGSAIMVKRSKKSNRWMWIILFIIIVCALGFVYWQNIINTKSKISPNDNNNITIIPVIDKKICGTSSPKTGTMSDNWLTFTSSEPSFPFSFKYPSNLVVSSVKNEFKGKVMGCDILISDSSDINDYCQDKKENTVSCIRFSVNDATGLVPPTVKATDVTLDGPTRSISAKYYSVANDKIKIFTYYFIVNNIYFEFRMSSAINSYQLLVPLDQFKAVVSSVSI